MSTRFNNYMYMTSTNIAMAKVSGVFFFIDPRIVSFICWNSSSLPYECFVKSSRFQTRNLTHLLFSDNISSHFRKMHRQKSRKWCQTFGMSAYCPDTVLTDSQGVTYIWRHSLWRHLCDAFEWRWRRTGSYPTSS